MTQTGEVLRGRFSRFMAGGQGTPPPPNRTPNGPNSEKDFADNPAVVTDVAAAEPRETPNITGFPSRNGATPEGFRVKRATGTPPVQQPGAAGTILRIPKANRLPALPRGYHAFPDFAIAANSGTVFDSPLEFEAHSVIIDNYSNIWLRVGNLNRYIPPYTVGVQAPCPQATQRVQVIAEAPPGLTQPNLGSTKMICSVFALEDEVPPSPGIPLASGAVGVPAGASATGTATQAATNIAAGIVPAGKTFVGTAMISAAAQNPLNTATGSLRVIISWAPGTGGTPAAQVVAAVDLELNATAATALVGAFDSGSISVPITVAAGSTAGTFTATVASTGTVTGMLWDVAVEGVNS